MSPTTVIDPDSDRRASMRSCMGERSCTSSTTMWPNERTSSSWRGLGPGPGKRRGGQALGPETRFLGAPLLGATRAAPGSAVRPPAGGRGWCAPRQSGRRRPPSTAPRRGRGCAVGRGVVTSSGSRMPLPGGRQQRAGAQQIVQQLMRGQARPHAVQRLGHLRGAPQALGQVGLLLGAGAALVEGVGPSRRGGRGSRRPAPAARVPRRNAGARCASRAGGAPWPRSPRWSRPAGAARPAPKGTSSVAARGAAGGCARPAPAP